MSWINMLSPWQWVLLAAIPPAIVLLYFLKLKRQPLAVPSTYLWHKSVEDLHVNSIWQRLRKSLLLLLQLLFIGVVALALLRPGWRGSQLTGHRFIFTVDTSASMSSTDQEPSRLDEAKRRVSELIEEMASGDTAMIVSFSDAARVEVPFTDNRRVLQRGLALIRPTPRRTSLGDALRIAVGQAGAGPVSEKDSEESAASETATMYLLSDGRFADVEDAPLGGLAAEYVPIGNGDAANVGITAFNTRRREDQSERLQAFARLENAGTKAVTAQVELLRDGTLADADEVELPPHGSGSVVFELGDVKSGVLQLRVQPGGSLALDDRAWAVIDPPARAKVLVVTPGDDALELALATDSARELADVEIARPDVLETQGHQDKASAGYYSLIIYDQCQPKQLPQANTLFIGVLPPGTSWTWGDPADAPQIIDVETAHPLMHLIDLGDVKFAEGRPLRVPEGGTVLVETDRGPLLAIAPRESFEDAVLGAEIVGLDNHGQRYANTDWPLRLSFPVFVFNSLGYFGEGGASQSATSVQPGQGVILRSTEQTTALEIRTPSGKTVSVARQQAEAIRFTGTDELGVYEVRETGQPLRRFAVNLFDSAETAIEPRAEVRIGYGEVKGQTTWAGARRELWKPLLVLALFVLCVEWYIYNRRVYL